jgi:hypothetical protein
VAVLSPFVASRERSRVIRDPAPLADTMTGRRAERYGSIATFAIESVDSRLAARR